MDQFLSEPGVSRIPAHGQFSNPWIPFRPLHAGLWKPARPLVDASTDEIAYPHLSTNEIREIAAFGETCSFHRGEYLVRAGDRAFNCHVLLAGVARVIDSSAGEPRLFTRYGAGCFTGDVYLLTGRRSIIDIQAESEIEAIRITPSSIREMFVRKPILGELFWKSFQRRRELLLASHFRGLSVYGSSQDRATLDIVELLSRNMVPYEWLDIAIDANRLHLLKIKPSTKHYPAVTHGDCLLFENPSRRQLAEYLGLRWDIADKVYDVVVLGAGPSGLGAAVHAASEGLATLVLDAVGPGGQAGGSSQIENYAGFPGGVSGSELANLTYLQALKFGAEFCAPCTVSEFEKLPGGLYHVKTAEGDSVTARSIIIAVGVSYRYLDVPGVKEFYGAGVYHSATVVEALRCTGDRVHVVGAGNSAGQAAMFLSQHAKHVSLLVRSMDLRKSMSSYLSDRLLANHNVAIYYGTEVTCVEGDERLTAVSFRNQYGTEVREGSSALFVFIGARPRTESLPSTVAKDKGGFIVTGAAVSKLPMWRADRCPCSLETSLPGVFAAGDCRSGTTKRVASAIGDGALAVSCVHQYLETQPSKGRVS